MGYEKNAAPAASFNTPLDHTMSGEPQYTIRRIQSGDADGLLHFYNGLSTTSNRTFQPLGTKTTLDVCLDIIQDNGPDRDKKIDLIAPGSIPRSLLRTFNFEIWKLKCLGACPEDLYSRYAEHGLSGGAFSRISNQIRLRWAWESQMIIREKALEGSSWTM